MEHFKGRQRVTFPPTKSRRRKNPVRVQLLSHFLIKEWSKILFFRNNNNKNNRLNLENKTKIPVAPKALCQSSPQKYKARPQGKRKKAQQTDESRAGRPRPAWSSVTLLPFFYLAFEVKSWADACSSQSNSISRWNLNHSRIGHSTSSLKWMQEKNNGFVVK